MTVSCIAHVSDKNNTVQSINCVSNFRDGRQSKKSCEVEI